MAKFKVLRGTVVLGNPKNVGDIVELEIKSQDAVELIAMGRIKLIEQEAAQDAVTVNRAVGLDETIKKTAKRGSKK